MSKRALNLGRRLRDLKDEHTEILERKSGFDHDVNRAVNALSRWGKEKERIETARPTTQQQPPPSQQNQKNDDKGHQEEDPDKVVEQVEQEALKERPESPPWAKKAYRQIVQITHPDKVDRDPDITDPQRDRLCALYIEATEAFKEGKWSELLEVAAELGIDVDADPKMMEDALESKIKELSESIKKVQGTISWAWGTSFGDLEKKTNILLRCCQIMGISPPPVAALQEIVRELEGSLEFDIVNRLGHVKRMKVESTKRKIGTRPQRKIR